MNCPISCSTDYLNVYDWSGIFGHASGNYCLIFFAGVLHYTKKVYSRLFVPSRKNSYLIFGGATSDNCRVTRISRFYVVYDICCYENVYRYSDVHMSLYRISRTRFLYQRIMFYSLVFLVSRRRFDNGRFYSNSNRNIRIPIRMIGEMNYSMKSS